MSICGRSPSSSPDLISFQSTELLSQRQFGDLPRNTLLLDMDVQALDEALISANEVSPVFNCDVENSLPSGSESLSVSEVEKSGYFVSNSLDCDPVQGLICLKDPPPLNKRKLQGLEISENEWKRFYTILYWYANSEKDEWVIVNTFVGLYGLFFGTGPKAENYGEKNMNRVFQHLQEWVDTDVDPAGFLKLQLRTKPLNYAKSVAVMISKWSSKSPGIKNNPFSFQANDSFDEEDDVYDQFSRKFPPVPTENIDKADGNWKKLVSSDLRCRLYYLILRHFPRGMGSRELANVWKMKYGHELNLSRLFSCSTEELFSRYMTDIFYTVKKSPIHYLIFVKLNIPMDIPQKILENACLLDAYNIIRRTEGIVAKPMEEKTPEVSNIELPRNMKDSLMKYLEQFPEGVTFSELQNAFPRLGKEWAYWHQWGLTGFEELKEPLEAISTLEMAFVDGIWWIKPKKRMSS